MMHHNDVDGSKLFGLVKSRKVVLAGNYKLKIYGTLRCRSGKRMKKANRIFFHAEAEALLQGFRPCGHCLPLKYEAWKSKQRVDGKLHEIEI